MSRSAGGGEARAAPSRGAPLWLLVSLAWLGPAILAALQTVVQARRWGEGVAWAMVAWQGIDWLLYALLTPIVFGLGRRYPLQRRLLARRVAIHVLFALVLTALWCVAGVLLHRVMMPGTTGPFGGGMLDWFLTSLPFGVAVYFAVLGVEHASFYFVRASEREAQAARLVAQLEEARMHALRMQLHPHFLLNSLNAIAVVVRDRDSDTAVRVVELLGDMLRRVMRTGGPPEVTLREELAFVRQYLEVEQVRFSDRLQPRFDVDDALLDAAVPEFLLQPLVENALRHGLARRPGAAVVELAARREGDDLVLTVSDEGPGPQAAEPPAPPGVALANIRERLATLYGGRASLTLTTMPGGGARATVRLPYRRMGGAHG